LVEATVQSRTDDDRTSDQTGETGETGETVIPLLAEEVTVSKQVVETGRVQVARVTQEREQLIDELLAHETVEIDRLPIGRQVDAMPAIREEGDTIVIPIVEEVLVVERRPAPKGGGARPASTLDRETPGERDPSPPTKQ